MKSLKYLIITILFHSCNGQESKRTVNYPKNKQMSTEHFNVNSFKNYQTAQEKSGNIGSTERLTFNGQTVIKEYSLISSENGIEYAKETIPPIPSLFYSLIIYDEQGKIKSSIDKVFIGVFDFEYGKHNFYDKEGYLTKQIYYNKQFDVVELKVEDVLNFLSKEDIQITKIDSTIEKDLKDKWLLNNVNFTPKMVLDKIQEFFLETKEERGTFEKKS